ncbi:hypothetical protein PILCRDRAFT_818480 [Piloderma croceum F 1598]|uniref:F-box domain-containing protein n=1 Tax=Piloderma croceum (strain F 1598) TaxID=765440 RepID=A0A0C3FX96_PILCF|nr:hypothetical protein PILCRDRAFT_818480 [Piloderma croceum F 1598]
MSSTLCERCGHTVVNDIELPTTPVPELLGGNYIATESQTQMICDTISSAQADISQLDGEITRLQAVLDGLAHKRDALHKYTNLHMALVAPIRRLPPEVLSEIFMQCMDEKNLSNLRLNTAPLLVGSVSSRWRTIALSTPRLWASFSLTIRPKYLKTDVVLAKAWLARADTCPLTICLSSKDCYQNTMKPLMDVFLLHCEQWYDIYLSVPLQVLHSLAPAKDRLPRLQKLYLNFDLEETISIFKFAPRLRWLRLTTSLAPGPSMAKVPWNQIEYLDMGNCQLDQCLDLLRVTPNLEKCAVWLSHSEPRRSHSPVQLLRLRSLAIIGDPSNLIDKLLLPNLSEISITALGAPWTATHQLTSLLSQCSLAKLSLCSDEPPSDDVMIQILQTCPSLVELNLRGNCSQCMTRSFLEQFASDRDREDSITKQLVPMLHTIKVDYSLGYFNIHDFADAIQSRIVLSGNCVASNAIARLQAVTIEHISSFFDSNVDSNATCATIIPRLRQLRRETGLEIIFLRDGEDTL